MPILVMTIIKQTRSHSSYSFSVSWFRGLQKELKLKRLSGGIKLKFELQFLSPVDISLTGKIKLHLGSYLSECVI